MKFKQNRLKLALLCCGLSLISPLSSANKVETQQNTEISSSEPVSSSKPLLRPFLARYVAYRNGSDIGEAIMSLEKTESGYKLFYQSDVSIFFLSDTRSETSLFKLVDEQLLPVEYHYKREGTGPDKSLKLIFNNDDKTVSIQSRKKDANIINWQGEWDNQLYRFDLQRQLKAQQTSVAYELINYRGQLKSYGFEVAGEEVLQLPFGKVSTIKVKTIRSSNKRETWSWFAPDLNYQLVRLQQFKDGDEQGDIQLLEYQVKKD